VSTAGRPGGGTASEASGSPASNVAAELRPFDPERFASLARARGLAWGRPLHYTKETGSTNDDALHAARNGAENGSLFVADHQTHGRGRRGKTWVAAPAQNLLFSILLRPSARAPMVSALTLAVGLGVRSALATSSLAPLRVKWPNDVLSGERKLAGILCEAQFDGPRPVAIVIGIGINVHDGPAQLPPELVSSSVCLEALTAPATPLIREELLAGVLAGVEDRVSACLERGLMSLLPDFAEHDALAGKRIEVTGASTLTGIARGVDPEGRLLVESDGILIPVQSGTVRAV
jgi:BirA family transcriptional regulator, biotin operon repressor / biotin---[acetyl-CoA-carboxylase] ligase